MKLKLTWLLTLFMAFVMQFSFAQEKTVTGTVTTADDGLPLPGASVIVKGTSRGQQTDFDGKYSIQVSGGEVLVISYVGMKNSEVIVGDGNTYDVALEIDNALDEVVVVGYGTTTKKAYAGTATEVKAEVLEAKNFSNVTQALTGEVAGVTVINTSGQPGTIGTVRIRGYGSPLGNRSPLYVVDGVQFAGNFDLNSINPADIKSTTVLKDATATAIYGSRGANGVVLITTKNGSKNQAGSVELEVKTGVNSQLIPRYDVLTSPEEYLGLVWEGLFNRGVVTNEVDPVAFANSRLLTNQGGIGDGYNMWDATTAEQLIDPTTRSVRAGVNRLFTPERYADAAFKSGQRLEMNLRFSGGNANTKYLASIGYFNDKGYSINTDFKRYTGRLNVTSDVKEWLQVGANISLTNSESTNNGQIAGSENIFEFADKMAPIYPVFARFPNSAELIPDPVFGGAQYDYGSPTGLANGFTRSRPNSDLLNPIGSAVLDFDGTGIHAFNGNIFANIKLNDWLKAELRYGGQYSNSRRNNVTNNLYGTGVNTNGSITVSDNIRWSQTFLQLLRFNKSFGNHNLEVLAAHETYEENQRFSSQFKNNVVVPGIYNLNNYLESLGPPTGLENGSAIESYFTQANYNFDNKYFITGSLRTDGSSRFVNDKWGVFGSIGGAWIASSESFLQDSEVTYLKLKGSWGITGDQQGVSTALGFTTFNANLVGGGLALSENVIGDPDLTWETSKMLQGGLELSLGNYLEVNVDYYRKLTDNLFFNENRGPSAGFLSSLINSGEIVNQGIEFDITGHIFNTEDFKLDLSVNGEIISNEFLTLPDDPSSGEERIIDTFSSNDGAYAYAAGRSLFDFWMREYAGVDPSNGSPLWYQYYDDANGNNILDAGEESFAVPDDAGVDTNTSGSLFEYRKLVDGANIRRTTTDQFADATQVFIDKSFIPDVRGAFRLSAKYKRFDLSTQFTYSLGGYAYDNQYAELVSDRFGAASTNFHKDIRNRWQQPGDITDVPILSDNAITNGSGQSTRFIVSTDFLALNNARLGYTLDGSMLDKTGLKSITLWVSGDNLFINTVRDGFNPSIREAGNSGRRIYAPPTTVTFGARIKF